MTDEEIICTFMGWLLGDWVGGEGFGVPARWTPTCLDLIRLHEVEARLTDEQWGQYLGVILPWPLSFRDLIHASAEQKIKALATVLRPEVESSLRKA